MATQHSISVGPGRSDVIDSLVLELCSAETLNGRYVVQLPVQTAFGSLVSVSIWPEGGGDTFLVTDDGQAYQEIVNAAASEKIFAHVAAKACTRYGAEFDGYSMLMLRVGKAQLKGAVIAMGSLTKEVIDQTIEKSFAHAVDQAHERFMRRANEAFAQYKRTERARVIGESTAEYQVDLLVETDHGALVFDYFSKSGVSVNAAYVTLSDIARREDAPRPIGVTRRLGDVGPKLALLSSVAEVIEAGANVEAYARLAA